MPSKTYAEVADGGDDHGVTPKDRLDSIKEANARPDGEMQYTEQPQTNGDTHKKEQSLDQEPPRTHELSDSDAFESDDTLEHEYGANGNTLTTAKSPIDYQAQIELDESEKPKHNAEPNSDLVSGRRAGAGWQKSKIRWAPLNIPLQRRLQTFTVLCHASSMLIPWATFFVLFAIPILWPILLPYFIYCLVSKKHSSGSLSRRSEWLRRNKVFSLFASYFPARLHRTVELEPTRKYIFGYHPHGIISQGAFAAFGTEALGFSQLFPGITNTLLTLDSNFKIPFYRDYALAMGLGSVSRESCENLLTKGGVNKEGMGRAITIVVGGARESLEAEPHTLRLVLKRRKGFVKLALRTGADLVPVICFGENDLHDKFSAEHNPAVHKAQLLVKKLAGFTVPLFYSRGVFNYDVGLLPYRRPLNIVVGRPIRIEQNRKPDTELVDRIHEQYVTELLKLWDDWKDRFAPERVEELRMIE